MSELEKKMADDALHGRTTLTNTDAMFGGTVMNKADKELIDLGVTAMRLAEDNMRLTQENVQLTQENVQLTVDLEKMREGMGKLVEQTLTALELTKFQSQQIQTLKAENDKLKGDDMADAYLKAEGEAADASHWGQVAVFIDLVRQMRAAQAEFFRTRDKDVMRKSIALEKEVDGEIKSNDNVAWVLQYLK